MGRLPFDQIDVLVVGELGKNYSGTGLDPNVIGRQRVETMPDLPRPVVTRLAVLDLSAETRGNALGIGLADLTTERLVARDRPDADAGQQPDQQLPDPRPRPDLALPDRPRRDRRLPRHLLADRPRRGPDGPDPEHAGADDPLGHAAAGRRGRGPSAAPRFETDFLPMPFDGAGTLDQEALFPESVRGRRAASHAQPTDLESSPTMPHDDPRRGLRPRRPDVRHRGPVLPGRRRDARARGKVFTPEIMPAMIGRQAAVAGPAFKAMAGLDEPVEELLAEARQRFYAVMDTAVHPTPGPVRRCSTTCTARGLPLAVGDLVAAGVRRAAARATTASRPLRVRARGRGRDPGQARPRDLPDGGRAVRRRRRLGPGAGRQPGGPGGGQGAGAFAVGVPHEHSPAEALPAADLIVPGSTTPPSWPACRFRRLIEFEDDVRGGSVRYVEKAGGTLVYA